MKLSWIRSLYSPSNNEWSIYTIIVKLNSLYDAYKLLLFVYKFWLQV